MARMQSAALSLGGCPPADAAQGHRRRAAGCGGFRPNPDIGPRGDQGNCRRSQRESVQWPVSRGTGPDRLCLTAMHMTDSQSRTPATPALAAEMSFVSQELARERRAQDELLARLLPVAQTPGPRLHYAGLILAIGLPRQDSTQALARRCQLALALELLCAALQTHRLLLATAPDASGYTDGAAVLMGDYNFARAAQLVTQLGNPSLLDAFANILKIASERFLASLTEEARPFHAPSVIAPQGILCGAHLGAHGCQRPALVADAWRALACAEARAARARALAALLRVAPAHQAERWRACGLQAAPRPSA